MKEILYVQAGSFSNFLGTHFWNTQESYFTYDGDEQEPQINHDISFREGLSTKGESTYCPRVLVFDKKANLGSSAVNGLYKEDAQSLQEKTWAGGVVEYRQEHIAQSQYHADLEQQSIQTDPSREPTVEASDVRYWSDYSRLYLHPRSIQKLPDTGDWESHDGNWSFGKESFTRYNQEYSLMEDSVRLFVEECDAIQGIQLTNETASFGSFVDSFLSEFRDEFVKLPIITFSILSEPRTDLIDVDDSIEIRKAVNDALCLRNLNDLSTLNVPILPPRLWFHPTRLPCDPNSLFQSSALLSAHLETATLPIRLKKDADDLASLCAGLNWRGDTRFAHLGGVLPLPDPTPFDNRTDFSALSQAEKAFSYSQRDVTRGFTLKEFSQYNDMVALSTGQRFLTSTHALAYPIPSSFPSYILEPSSIKPHEPTGIFSRSRSTSMMSSLTTTSLTASLFSNYATFIDRCVQRKVDTGTGVELDDLKDLGNELWTLHDNFYDGEPDYIDGGMAEDD